MLGVSKLEVCVSMMSIGGVQVVKLRVFRFYFVGERKVSCAIGSRGGKSRD